MNEHQRQAHLEIENATLREQVTQALEMIACY